MTILKGSFFIKNNFLDSWHKFYDVQEVENFKRGFMKRFYLLT